MGPSFYESYIHIHGPFNTYQRFSNHHMLFHDRIFRDEDSTDYTCRFCPCEILSCSARYVTRERLIKHLWAEHATDKAALFYYTHKYCDLETGLEYKFGFDSGSSTEPDCKMDAVLEEGEVESLSPHAFDFNLSRMQTSGDDAGVLVGGPPSTEHRDSDLLVLDNHPNSVDYLKIPQSHGHDTSYVHGPSQKSFDPSQVPRTFAYRRH
jgi:hypothetical protein